MELMFANIVNTIKCDVQKSFFILLRQFVLFLYWCFFFFFFKLRFWLWHVMLLWLFWEMSIYPCQILIYWCLMSAILQSRTIHTVKLWRLVCTVWTFQYLVAEHGWSWRVEMRKRVSFCYWRITSMESWFSMPLGWIYCNELILNSYWDIIEKQCNLLCSD